MFSKIMKLFKKKVIVHSRTHMPAVFIKHVKGKNGKRYVRVKFTNRVKYQGAVPLTDIPFENVLYIRVFAPLIVEKIYRRFGWKVPEKIIVYNKNKKVNEQQQSNTSKVRKA